METILNLWSIISMSSDPADLLSLTPGHFLIESLLTSRAIFRKIACLSRWQRVEQIR